MATFDVVFSGGGTKGVAYAGALDVLENQGHTVRRVIGTSAGAITATLVAAGYKPRELLALAKEKIGTKPAFYAFLSPPGPNEILPLILRPNSEVRGLYSAALKSSLDKGIDYLGGKSSGLKLPLQAVLTLYQKEFEDAALDAFLNQVGTIHPALAASCSFLEVGGFFSAEKFRNWLTAKLKAKYPTMDDRIGLKAFFDLTGRDLTVVVADTTDRRALILNHRTAPFVPVVQAVRMSMSIPMVWQEATWLPQWGKYLGEEKTGHSIVDGGTISNFPIRYFVQTNDPDVRRIMGDPGDTRTLPIGMMLDAGLDVQGDVYVRQEWESKTVGRLGRLIDTCLSGDEEVIRQHPTEVCRIPCKGYNALEFAMSTDRMETLINSGRCAITEHLKERKVS